MGCPSDTDGFGGTPCPLGECDDIFRGEVMGAKDQYTIYSLVI